MKYKIYSLNLSLILVAVLAFSMSIVAQEPTPEASPSARERVSKNQGDPRPSETPPAGGQDGTDKSPRQETTSEEEAALLPYYNNYLKEYHLGPEDVISVDVFGQPNYSKAGITIPPTAVISYPLIPGGVFVAGKTTDQVAAEIKKKLEEYIIDPNVTVTLDKVGSAQFAVLGKVGAPGIRTMTRRYNLYEAVIEAGGIAQGGDSKRVTLIRRTAGGGYSQSFYDFKSLLSGKGEVPYLVPGDQVIVPEKKWSMTKILDILGKASAFRILFGSPF